MVTFPFQLEELEQLLPALLERLRRMQRDCDEYGSISNRKYKVEVKKKRPSNGTEQKLRSSNYYSARDPTAHNITGGYSKRGIRMGRNTFRGA